MDDFKIMYKILKILDESMDLDEFDPTGISPEALGCTVQRRDRLLIKMQEAGYISGLQIKRFMRQEAFIASPIMPEITINGIQFLHEKLTDRSKMVYRSTNRIGLHNEIIV